MKIVKDLTLDSDADKKLFYMCNVRPILNTDALFADATADYRIPEEPIPGDTVTLKFRTERLNADRVFVNLNGKDTEMERAESDANFDYFTTAFEVTDEHIYYYFRVVTGRTVVYYNQLGPDSKLNPYYDFQIMPGFITPAWAKGAVAYQIFTDRFCNGDKSNDVLTDEYSYLGDHVKHIDDWNQCPSADNGVREFYGGDLQGVLDKMDYLQDLGVEAIYFNPLFVSPSNHKYDIQDYDYIDPHFGKIVDDEGNLLAPGDQDNTHAARYINRVTNTVNLEAGNALFRRLVEEAHRRGMHVIIDGVFNHCGSFNRWMDREHIYKTSQHSHTDGAYVSKDSPYHDFFQFNADAWPDNKSYDGWWGHDTLPKLNYEASSQLEDMVLGIAAKWVSPPYMADGWRLDVAADLGHSPEYNHAFWKKFRAAVKQANSDAIIIAENYGDSYNWLQGDEWDTVMDYDAFMEPVTWFLTGMQKHSDEFRKDMLGNADSFFDAMRYNMARLGGQAARIAMNELSNHDHSRFLTRTNRTVGRLNYMGSEAASRGINKAVMMEAVVIQMTWPGMPTVYYGDEAGVCGWTDPDNRRTYPWGHADPLLLSFHKAIIRLHKTYPVLRFGSLKKLKAEYNLIAYGRFDRKDQIIVVVNNSEDERRVILPVWELGLSDDDDVEQIFVTYDGGYSQEPLGYRIRGGSLNLGMRKTSAMILRKKVW